MSRPWKAAWIGGGLALLAGHALAQGGAGAAGGMTGRMGGFRTGPAAVDQWRQMGSGYNASDEYAKALAALKASRFREAARFAEHVVDAAPSHPEAWRLLGAAYAGDRNWKGSRRAYAKAVGLGPDDPSAHAGLGLALAYLSDAKALEQLVWLRDRASVCGDTCPDAEHLQTYTTTIEDAIRMSAPPAAAPASPE